MFGFTIYEKLNVLHEITAKCIFDCYCCLLLNYILIQVNFSCNSARVVFPCPVLLQSVGLTK